MMISVWRTVRVLRLHWLLLLSIFSLVFLNLLLSTHRQQEQQQQQQQQQKQQQEKEQQQIIDFDNTDGFRRPFRGRVPAAAPQVEKELSTGVKEEENSAREVLDVEGSDEDKEDVDAANEVNSMEPETNGDKKVGGGDLAPPNWRNLTAEEISRMSVLGRHMFLGEEVGPVQDKTFTILVWKNGPSMENRFLKQYGKVKIDPFKDCSTQNCHITYDDEAAATADAILFHLHRTKGPQTFPNRTRLDQRWVWLTDESAYNTFMVAKVKKLEAYNGFFNWSMSYRMDTDVPVPYGRTVTLTREEVAAYQPVDYFDQKPKLVAIMGSNCGGRNRRWTYVKELKKHMTVDAYGGCGNLKCPGHFKKDCPLINQYKFYLSFENSNCKEYITEKVWWNALEKGAVPVVMGTKVEDYRRVLPPGSFIHVDDFQTPESLAQYLTDLGNNKKEYMKFHAWRAKYRVANEHGYFNTPVFHYCRLCEALNYNSPEPKMYNDLIRFWSKDNYCYEATWMDRMTSQT